MKRFSVHVPGGFYAFTAYGKNRRDALRRLRENQFPSRQRLPRGTAIWEA